jgi:hypothetical protein
MSTLDENAIQLVKHDLELRASELEVNRVRAQQDAETRQLEITKNAEIAEQSIKANLEIENGRKEAFNSSVKTFHTTARTVIVAVFFLIVAAFIFGEKETVIELFKTIAAIVGASFGAYYFGKSRSEK